MSDRRDAPLTVWFDDADATSTALVGGKYESLAEMARSEFAVPTAFAITTVALTRFMLHDDLLHRAAALQAIDRDDLSTLSAASSDLLHALESAPMPADVEQAIRDGYAELERRSGCPRVPVAVRSSGVSEDLAGASFAGQYDTYLWICGADELLTHVRRCWAGLFGEAVLTYRPDALAEGLRGESAGMGVVVQRMVDARSAGVAFTVDPVSGDRSKIVIESSWGLGEAVVSGEVTPDRFRVDKVTLEIIERFVSDKAVEFRFDAGHGVRLVELATERRVATSVEDAEVTALATLVKRIERHRGAPQDVEWAIADDGSIAVLQVRPETVWSQRAAAPVAVTSTNPLDLVLGTFMGATTRAAERQGNA